MTRIADYRTVQAFSSDRIARCATNVGRGVYPKLYNVENLLRILIHSILSAQLGTSWWGLVVDPKAQQRVVSLQKTYAQKPRHANQGKHEIYYLGLPDLTEIVRVQSNLLTPTVANVSQLILHLESIRLPRNVVAHMNFPNAYDEQQILDTHKELKQIMRTIERNANLPLRIP